MLEKIFKLKENNTTAKTEIIAGLTTFMTMAYIIALNPNCGQSGNDLCFCRGVVFLQFEDFF